MAMTYNQIKKSVLGKNYDVNRNIERRKEEENLSYSEIKSRVLSGGYDFSKVKSRLEREIGFETLGDDITSLNKRLTESATGWQTSETMNTVRSSVDSMQGRLMAYKEYEKLFGGGGDSLKDLRSSYSSAMDNWDGLIEQYGNYNNAEAYTKETEMLANLGKMTSSDVEAKINEIKELEDIFNTARGYANKMKGATQNARNFQNRSGGAKSAGGFADDIKGAEKNLNDYLSSVGYKSVDEIEKALGAKHVAYTTVNGENITWQSLYKQKKEQEETDALYKEVSANDDFKKYKYEGMNVKNPEFKDSKGQRPLWFGEDVENKAEFARDNREAIALSNAYASFGDKNIYYTYLNDQEREMYNYYLGKEKAGLLAKGTSDNYLDSLDKKLKDRHDNQMLYTLVNYTKESPLNATLASGISVWQNLGAGGEWLIDSAKYLQTGELDKNQLAQGSSAIRSTVSNMVDWEIGNWDAFDFVYNSSMSMIDSATAMATLGGAGGVALGLSAAAQGTNEALERGLDNKRAFASGLASGVFEGLFETYSIGKFKSLKELPSSGVKSVIKNISKSMLVNASEETLTEIANITYDNIVNGDLSDAKTKIRAYVNAGLSESEAKRKVALEQGTQVAEAGLSGAFMGLGFGGISSGISYHNSKTIGQNIKANDRAGDVFNLANNPEIASAYDTYTEYAKKGITAENATKAQVGSLAQIAGMDAKSTLESKKSTPEQKAEAQKVIDDLKVYSQGNVESRTGSATNLKKKFVKETYDAETVDALIESGLESAEGTEAYKLATEYKAKVESGKNLSVEEIARLSDANDMAIKAEENAEVANELIERGESKDIAEIAARKLRGEILTTEEGAKLADSDIARQVIAEHNNAENVTDELLTMAQSMDSKDRALFVALYDGKTDVEAYANAFNLAVMKSENNYSENDILKTRSVLSGTQVAKIYEEARIKADKAETDRFKSLVKATADKKFYKGNINESVIDYNNTSAEGKVNWKDLDSRQRKAVTFMNGFAKATGINLVWTKDDEKANGKYNRDTNTLYLDVYAGIDHADKLADTIIPTASHELTHWMEKKSPEFFRKINDLVFSTLYEHDGRTEEKRIKDEMARTGKSEDVVRSEIIARACEEVLSKSEQGKKIFNSLSKSEQKTFVDKIKEIIQDVIDWVSEMLGLYGKDSLHYEARVLHQYQDKLAELVKLWDEALVGAVEVNQALEKSGLYGNMESIGSIDLKELAKAVGINGESLFQYKAIVEDEAIYREMLHKHKDTIGITNADINALFDMIDKAVDIISKNVEALDFAWEADIDDRAFNPVKANSDKLYQVSLDFSTLCRKRLLQQTVQQTLQNALNKQLSKEESIAIRDELMKIQEEGRKIEVACALCYVEAARMKSPEQIKKFLNNREASIREFFANRSLGDIKAKIEEAEMKAREKLKADNPDGYYGKNDEKLDILTAPKSRMKSADAKFVRDEGKKVKASYEMTAHEQAELDAALKMTVTDFTSAEGLEKLAKNHPDLFDAYTSFVRNATHSKGIENDTWWRAGDSDSIGDSLIAKMNEENGLRSQSWSDFQVIHLLDYIAATIELSTKGAKRQSYTKVPDYVKLLGNTGDMINLSLIPERVFEGKLKYDAVEGMAYEIAKKLRDEYHATVGTVCIGINDEQIKMLLMDEFIDYVIPYHHSSMSKATRKLMHIPAWESYQDYQSEKKLKDTEALANAKKYGVTLNKDAKYQKSPNFSEWFDIEEARQIAKMENEHPSDMEAYKKYGKMYGGYKAMQNAANNYLKLCAERGLAPKFSMGTDFTQEANYWKLLIDRKMVDNITGEVIEQKAIKPIFNEKHVLEILTDELERYPQVKADQEYAVRKVTEKFLSGEMKVDASTLEAIKKPIDNVTEVNILESSREDVDLSKRIFTEQVDEVIAGTFDRTTDVYVGKLPDILRDIGLNGNLPMLALASHIRKAIMPKNTQKHQHGLTDVQIKSIPDKLANPVMIMDSLDESKNSIVVVTDMLDVDKSPIIVSIKADGVGRYNRIEVDSNFLTGYYGRDGFANFIANNVTKDTFLYINKEKATILETESSTSWLEQLKNYDFDTIIRKTRAKVKENSSERDSEYLELAKNPKANEARIRKMVEEAARKAGYNVRAYHGTSRGGFTSFDTYGYFAKYGLFGNGAYFTESLKIAKEYQNKGKGNNKQVYDVYLKFNNVIDMDKKADISEWKKSTNNQGFDIAFREGMSNEEAFRAFEEELEYEEIPRYEAEEIVRTVFEDMGYDGITHMGGGRIYDNERHRVWIAFEPTAIKSADLVTYDENGNIIPLSERFNDKKDNILYSERDDVSVYDLMGENERIKKQNEKFKAEVENLRELLAIEKKVTNGNYIANSKALAAAEVILKRGNSNYDKVKLAKELKGVYEYIAESEGSKYDALFRKCYEMADNVLREAKEEKVVDDHFKSILKDIRTTRISLDDMQKQEAKHLFGDHWNRNFMGKVIIAEDGTSLDSQWQEWAGRYPNQFSADMNPNDQIGELYDIINSLQESSETVVEYDMEERRRWLAEEIFNTFWNIPTVETTADKYDKRIKELKAEHKKSIAKVREEYNERLDKQKMIDDMYYGRKMRDIYRNIRKRTDAEVAMAKAHGREMLEGYKERAEKKTKIQSITSIALRLNDMLVKNNKDKHINEAMKGPVANLIKAIDFSSKSLLEKGVPTKKDISLQKALRQVSTMMHNAGTGQADLIDLYGHGLDADIERMVANVDDIVENLGSNEFVLQMMSLEDLKTLDLIMRDVRHAVNKVNEFHVVQHKAGVEALGMQCEQELADRTKIYLDKNGKEDTNKHFDKMKTSLFWNNTTPYYAFKHFGASSQKMFAAFQDAQDKMAFVSKEVTDFANSVYTAKEYKAWAKQYFDFEVVQPDGKPKKFSMNVPQIMSLYCVYKQDDAKRHIHANGESGGITLVETDKKAAINTNIRLSPKDVQNIIGVLGNTAEVGRAKEVADKLQEFMGRRGAELGNEISMARWGIKSFGIEDYFPIKVSAGTVEQKNETPGVEAHSLLALLNMSFTHSRNEYADQSVEIGDVFDIFANHMSDMIRYNAMAMPIIDMYKWMNIRGNDGFGKNHSIETSIKDAFGNHAWNYINTFMKDVNGSTKKSTRDKLAVRFFRNAKIAKVAGNIRVALLQFTSFVRAGAVMDNKYLLKALFHTPKISKAKEHCGIALWKSLGYYDTDITRGLTEKIKHDDAVKDKIIELSLKGAEKADEITWGCLWNACELEVRETRKDLKVGSPEFYKEIGLRLRDIVYRTQVVDSMLTRSQLMRSPDSWDKVLTTFASESALSLNLAMDAFVETSLDARSMGKKEAWKKNGKYIRKTVTALVVTNMVTAALQSVFDAFRDHYEDDKDEEYWAKLMLENFALNTSFLNKLPYFNTIISIFSGFSASRFDVDWATDVSKMVKEISKLAEGKGSAEKAVRYALKALSDSSGIPGYNIYRDLYAIYKLFADNE